jgi:predicted RNase H-like nuclease (RuvC/YqgF family)
MLDHHIDLDLLRRVIDALEVERNRNDQQDMNIDRISHQNDDLERRLERLESETPQRLEFLESEFRWVRQRVDRTIEVEQWIDHYSSDGSAICNSLEDFNSGWVPM